MTFKFVCRSVTKESIVDVTGVVTKTAEKVKGCSQKDVELQVKTVSLQITLFFVQYLGFLETYIRLITFLSNRSL